MRAFQVLDDVDLPKLKRLYRATSVIYMWLQVTLQIHHIHNKCLKYPAVQGVVRTLFAREGENGKVSETSAPLKKRWTSPTSSPLEACSLSCRIC